MSLHLQLWAVYKNFWHDIGGDEPNLYNKVLAKSKSIRTTRVATFDANPFPGLVVEVLDLKTNEKYTVSFHLEVHDLKHQGLVVLKWDGDTVGRSKPLFSKEVTDTRIMAEMVEVITGLGT